MARAVEIEWNGETYFIPESETFQVAEQIEEIIDLADYEQLQHKPKLTKIAKCYGIMLRHAGADVTDAQLHQEILRGAVTGEQKAEQVLVAMSLITHFLTAGMPLEAMGEEDVDDKKKPQGSSKVATKSRSKASKSPRLNSGK